MEKALSLNEIRSRCAQFVVEWRDADGDERQEAQSFVRDLLAAFGITETRAALYEKRAQRSSTGNQGYIDALVPGLLLIEMKSAGKNLGLAEIQALDYVDALPDAESPNFVLTCNFKDFRLLDLKAPSGKDVTEFSIEELPRFAESLAFLAGYKTRNFGTVEEEQASIEAAKMMAELYEALEGSGYSDHEASVFLVRTLFALYADDSGIWERDLFTEFLENRTSQDGSDLGSQLSMLFQVLDKPRDGRAKTLDESLARFPYVNGGIFHEPLSIPSFDRKMREKLLKACAFNWAEISPAIFGSLFQAVKSPEARRALGEHYTTETNIKKAIDPLFLDELHDQFDAARYDIRGLKRLLTHLRNIRVMDPACGSGNFLIVAYRELRQLELSIRLRLQELDDRDAVPTLYFDRDDLAVQLENMRGIELEEWPARIAQTALRLVDHQANMQMQLALGKAPDTLPLDTVLIIHTGNSLRLAWQDILEPTRETFIVGNPPFVGQWLKSVDQTADMKYVWGKDYNGYLDYVTGWFKKAIDYFTETAGGRFAFVSTNSVTQGQPVPALFRPIFQAGWRIRFAHTTFPWTSEAPGAAAVHCVITGFDRETKAPATLFTTVPGQSRPVISEVDFINGYLIAGPNVFIDKRSKPLSTLLPPARFGSKPVDGGNLIVSTEEYSEVSRDPVAAKYLRPFLMGRELIHHIPRWCLWLEDLEPSDTHKSQILADRLIRVRDARSASKKAATRILASTPQLFGENHQPSERYVGIPRVFSENRHFATVQFLEPNVIAGDKVYTCIDPDGFAFAIFSSSMFITWQKAIGGRLESRLNFSNTVVWNNLPLPGISDDLRLQIIEAGKLILEARAKFPGRSLADHYNPLAMDRELLGAHASLDKLVDKAFGATQTLRSNDERLPILFERFEELAPENRPSK